MKTKYWQQQDEWNTPEFKRLKALEEEAEAGLATFVILLTGEGSED